MKKYKLYKKDFQKWKDMIYILPTITIVTDNMIYDKKNFSVEFHFLVWHCRFLWLMEG